MLYATSTPGEEVVNVKSYKQTDSKTIRSPLLNYGSYELKHSAHLLELQSYLAEIPQQYHSDLCSCFRWTV